MSVKIYITDNCCDEEPKKNFVVFTSKFVDGKFQDDRLKGLQPLIDFNLVTMGGSGVIEMPGNGYSFDKESGTITAPAANYLILF